MAGQGHPQAGVLHFSRVRTQTQQLLVVPSLNGRGSKVSCMRRYTGQGLGC